MKQVKLTFIFFFILSAIQTMAANFAHPVTPTLIQALDLESYSFGLFFAGMAFSNFLFSPMWAKQVKRLGSRMVLGICCIGYALGQIMFIVFTTIPTILIARLFAGFFVGGIMVSYLTYILAKAPEDKKASYLATSASINVVSTAFGYFIGGFVGVHSFYSAFILQIVTLAACGILFMILLEDDKEKGIPFSFRKDANPFNAFMDAKKFMTPAYVLVFLCVFISSLATTCFDQSFNYYLNDVFELSSAYNGTIKAIVGVISLIANMTICVWLLNKTNFKKNIAFIFLGCSLTILSLGLIDVFLIYTLIVLVFFGFNAIYQPILQNICAVDSMKEDSNMVMGFYNSMKSLGMIIGALYAGFIYDFGNTLPFISAGIFFLIAMIVIRKYADMKR